MDKENTTNLSEHGTGYINKRLMLFMKWADINILPVFSIMLLAGLSVRGAQTFLQGTSPSAQTAISIAAVSFFIVKAFQRYSE